MDDRLIEAVTTGARRASVHAMRAVGEMVSAVMAFVDEVGNAFADDDPNGAEHIEVEPDDDSTDDGEDG